LSDPETSFEKFSKACNLFLSLTSDNTPRYIMDLTYVCQTIVESIQDGIEFESEMFRVLSEHNLYGIPLES